MNDKKLEQVLNKVEPARRTMLKKLVLGAGFAVPVIASFSVKDLAAAGTGSLGTLTVTLTTTGDVTVVTDTVTTTFPQTTTTTTFTTSTVTTTVTVIGP